MTLKRGQHLKYQPYAFTEHGILMLSSVLNSDRAIQVNIAIMRTFVKLRRMVIDNAVLAHKLDALEQKYDRQFKIVFDAIRQLMSPPSPLAKTDRLQTHNPQKIDSASLSNRLETFSFTLKA